MAVAPNIAFANLNFAESPHTFKAPEWLGDFVYQAGYSGVEFTPILPIFPNRPARIARAVLNNNLVVTSQHASFRMMPKDMPTVSDEKSSPNLRDRILNSRLGGLVLPDMRQSTIYMRRLQDMIGDRPAVLYPLANEDDDVDQIKRAGSRQTGFQPTDAVARQVGVHTIEDFDHTMRSRGYKYVADFYHIRRRYGRSEPGVVSNIEKSLPVIAPYTEAIHLSLSRVDIAGEDHIPTFNEGKKALKGEYTGQLREMLDILKEQGNVQLITVELTLNALKGLIGHESDMKSQIRAYEAIADGIREYWWMK